MTTGHIVSLTAGQAFVIGVLVVSGVSLLVGIVSTVRGRRAERRNTKGGAR